MCCNTAPHLARCARLQKWQSWLQHFLVRGERGNWSMKRTLCDRIFRCDLFDECSSHDSRANRSWSLGRPAAHRFHVPRYQLWSKHENSPVESLAWLSLFPFAAYLRACWQLSVSVEQCSVYLATVKFASLIFSVSQSTFLLVLQKMTACVIVRVS